MKTILANYKIFILLLVSFIFLNSCSEIGLLSETNSLLVKDINSFGDFMKVFIQLQISILLVSLIISIFLGELGYIISLVIHYIWIISARDYGFFKVLLLFGLFTIVTYLINLLILMIRSKRY